jgi:glycosyltransferase involved in cell wall biosynthesis
MIKNGPRVLHVITGLFPGGGAETLLVRLLEALGEERAGHSVLSLRPRWALAHDIEQLGVPVHAVGMSGRPTPADIVRLGRILRESEAEVVQTWMLHANVLGLVARMVSGSPVVWGVHLSEASRSTLGTKAVVVQRCEAICSWFVPSRIVACSASSREVMQRLRYRGSRIVTIPNGFDVMRFRPDAAVGKEIRRELGLPATTTVIGHLARFHPIKDHATLLAAAGQVLGQVSDVRFVLCGDGVTPDNPKLSALAAPLGDGVLMLGQRNDVPRLLNAFDLAVSSSSGEALPLAIGEAMATGLPVVATRCGDSEELVADTGAITPVGDPTALARAMIELVKLGPETRKELGRRARARISSSYSLEGMAEGYQETWADVGGADDRL